MASQRPARTGALDGRAQRIERVVVGADDPALDDREQLPLSDRPDRGAGVTDRRHDLGGPDAAAASSMSASTSSGSPSGSQHRQGGQDRRRAVGRLDHVERPSPLGDRDVRTPGARSARRCGGPAGSRCGSARTAADRVQQVGDGRQRARPAVHDGRGRAARRAAAGPARAAPRRSRGGGACRRSGAAACSSARSRSARSAAADGVVRVVAGLPLGDLVGEVGHLDARGLAEAAARPRWPSRPRWCGRGRS